MNKLNTDQFGNSEQPSKTEQSFRKLSHDAGEAFGSMASDIKATTSGYTKIGKAYVNENPSKSLAISAAAGAVVGSLVTLAVRRRK